MNDLDSARAVQRDVNNMARLLDERNASARLVQRNDAPSFKVLNVAELTQLELRKPEPLLTPWLYCQNLSMVYAWRGVGKTHVALGIAFAVASGGQFLNWIAPTPRHVLYLDGEMPASTIQERLRGLVLSSNEDFDPENLRILTPDLQDRVIPDLGTLEGQDQIEEIRSRADLIIVDNLSCLARNTGASENDAESWRLVQDWALRLRREGCAVLFVHHSGKGGQQRGTSKREDVLDTVIELKRPNDYHEDEGARFEVHYNKHRHFHGRDAAPFEATLTTDAHGVPVWTTRSLEESTFDRVVALAKDGLKPNDIARELDVHRSTVSRHLGTAAEKGLVERKATK